jgi:predicted restriction endonuclease
MTKHCKIYLKHFGYTIADFIPCEVCNRQSVDIHHVKGRGKNMDRIENLAALCRTHHTDCHNELISKDQMQIIHDQFLKNNL